MEKEQLNIMRKEYASFLNAELGVDKSMIKESLLNYITDKVNYENKVCLDLGSNLGAFCKIAIDNGAKNVVAVECDTRNYEKVNYNFREIDNVEVIHAAVSESTEKTLQIFKSSAKSNHSSTSIIKRTNRFKQYEVVDNVNFTEIVNKVKPDIIKIDIEGAEHNLIDEIIAASPDVLFLELHGGYEKCQAHLDKLEQAYPNSEVNEIIMFMKVGGFDCLYYK